MSSARRNGERSSATSGPKKRHGSGNEISAASPRPPSERHDQIFEEGMELWWSGDRRGAVKYFRRVLTLSPLHADAHNHLGIASQQARKLRVAEEHYRAAVEGGSRQIERDGSEVPWDFLENRPYLRGLGNLALVLADQGKWAEALEVHKRLLKLNPNDNQGVRYLIGPELLRVGDDIGAIEAFERCTRDEVGCAFGLALAKLRAHGPATDIGEALIAGFAGNRYVAPMLLGDPWERLDAFHGTNMAEPEWASDVVMAQEDLWRAVPRGAERLRFWWAAPAVAAWRAKIDAIMLHLKSLPPSAERSAMVDEWSELRSERTMGELVRTVHKAS